MDIAGMAGRVHIMSMRAKISALWSVPVRAMKFGLRASNISVSRTYSQPAGHGWNMRCSGRGHVGTGICS